jgi:hypothetical protein
MIPFEDGYYAVDAGGRGFVRRLSPSAQPRCTSPSNGNILEVVRARVIWIGHFLEKPIIAEGPVEEAGSQY